MEREKSSPKLKSFERGKEKLAGVRFRESDIWRAGLVRGSASWARECVANMRYGGNASSLLCKENQMPLDLENKGKSKNLAMQRSMAVPKRLPGSKTSRKQTERSLRVKVKANQAHKGHRN